LLTILLAINPAIRPKRSTIIEIFLSLRFVEHSARPSGFRESLTRKRPQFIRNRGRWVGICILPSEAWHSDKRGDRDRSY
jgi:hypothetical protein